MLILTWHIHLDMTNAWCGPGGSLLKKKTVAKGFVGGSRVNKYGSCDSHNGICVKGGVRNFYRVGNLTNKWGSHALCIKTLPAPTPITCSQFGKGRENLSIPSISIFFLPGWPCFPHWSSFCLSIPIVPIGLLKLWSLSNWWSWCRVWRYMAYCSLSILAWSLVFLCSCLRCVLTFDNKNRVLLKFSWPCLCESSLCEQKKCP